MFRKEYFSTFLFITIFLAGSVLTFAQNKTIGGRVELKKAEGAKTPVEGVQIDCYRVDIKQKCRSAKTDKKGEFTIIGIPIGASVFLAVSGPGIAPQVTPARLDNTNVVEVKEGEGPALTEQQVREVALAYASQKGNLTAEQKKELEELEKKRAEIAANNEKIEKKNEAKQRLIKEGNAAFNKKDYDTAIVKFDEGYKVDTEFLGSAPVFLNNKAMALKERAVRVYNAAAKSKTLNEEIRIKVAKDFNQSLDAAITSYSMLKGAKSAEIENATSHKANIKTAEDVVKDSFRIMNIIQLNLGTYISDEKDAEKVVSIYKTSWEILPKDNNVLVGLGLALYTASAFTGNVDQKQESIDYLAHFLKVAPKNHKMYTGASELVAVMKSEDKLKPRKVKN